MRICLPVKLIVLLLVTLLLTSDAIDYKDALNDTMNIPDQICISDSLLFIISIISPVFAFGPMVLSTVMIMSGYITYQATNQPKCRDAGGIFEYQGSLFYALLILSTGAYFYHSNSGISAMQGGRQYACTFVNNPIVYSDPHFCVVSEGAEAFEPWVTIFLGIHVLVSMITLGFFMYKLEHCFSQVSEGWISTAAIGSLTLISVLVGLCAIGIYSTFSPSYGQNAHKWPFLNRRCNEGEAYTKFDCTEDVDENVAQCAQCNATSVYEQIAEYRASHTDTKGMCRWRVTA